MLKNLIVKEVILNYKKNSLHIIIKAKKLDIANRNEALANNEKSLQDMISIIKKLIEEYESNNEPQKITEIVNIYNENLREILVNIRTNKYFINRVNVESKRFRDRLLMEN